MADHDIFRQVARIHIESISQGFLTSLGENFLTLLYQVIDECGSSVLLIERDQERVIGFVAGAENMGPIYKQLLRHFPRLLVTLIPTIFKPSKIWRIIELFLYNRNKPTIPGHMGHELISIAVLQTNMRQGIAQRLYGRLATYFYELGAPSFHIVVGVNLKPAHGLYKRMGARPMMEISVHDQKKSIIFFHDLT